jgi:hypothetical protein
MNSASSHSRLMAALAVQQVVQPFYEEAEALLDCECHRERAETEKSTGEAM